MSLKDKTQLILFHQVKSFKNDFQADVIFNRLNQ